LNPATDIEAVRAEVLAFFPSERRHNRLVRELADRFAALTAATDLPARLDAFVELSDWTRGGSTPSGGVPDGGALPERSTRRLRMALDVLEGSPAVAA